MPWYDPFSDPNNQFTADDLRQIQDYVDWEDRANRIGRLLNGEGSEEPPDWNAIRKAVRSANKKGGKKKAFRPPQKRDGESPADYQKRKRAAALAHSTQANKAQTAYMGRNGATLATTNKDGSLKLTEETAAGEAVRWAKVLGGKITSPDTTFVREWSTKNSPYGVGRVVSITQAVKEFYGEKDPKAIKEWQQKLYAAGFYSPYTTYYTNKNPKQPAYGINDPDTQAAFLNMLTQAAVTQGTYHTPSKDGTKAKRFGGRGGDFQDLLKEHSDATFEELSRLAADKGGGGGGGGGGGTVYQLSDPAQLDAFVNVMSTELLGRGVTPDEKARIIQRVRDEELASEQVEAGPVDQVDPESRIAKMLREMYPVEAQAHDIVGMYSDFTKLLAGPSGGAAPSVGGTRGF